MALTDEEIVRRHRARNRRVIGCRFPVDIAEEIIRRAERADVGRGRVVVQLVQGALEREAKP